MMWPNIWRHSSSASGLPGSVGAVIVEPEPPPEPVSGAAPEPWPVVSPSGCLPPQAASANDAARARRAFMPSSIAQLFANRLVTRGSGALSFAAEVSRRAGAGTSAAGCGST